MCDRLHWGSVALMLEGMSAGEFMRWRVLCEVELAEREEADKEAERKRERR